MSADVTYEILFPFSEYEVERILGKLPSGRVGSWLARNKKSDQRVVIKEVSLAASSGHQEWLDRRWNGWIPILEVKTGAASAIYIREYLEGAPLALPFAAGGWFEALKRVADISATLAPLHALRQAHGRLKPGNIIVDAEGRVNLSDPTFDPKRAESQPDEGDTGDHSIAFDVHYVSPEQIRGEPATPATDIYSLGCIFYEQFTGVPPYSNPSPLMTCHQHLTSPYPGTERLGFRMPSQVEQVVRRMLSKSPTQRPWDVMALLDLLEPLLDPAFSPASADATMKLSVSAIQKAAKAKMPPAKEEKPATPITEVDEPPTQSQPVLLVAPSARTRQADPGTGTLIITRKELRRLIENNELEKAPTRVMPAVSTDEAAPIPLVQAKPPAAKDLHDAETSISLFDSKTLSKAVIARAAEQAAKTQVFPAMVSDSHPAAKTESAAERRSFLMTALWIYSVIVTLLLLVCIVMIVLLLSA
jgi:serine/threonine protein kinase